jgi:hypothetical protein
MRLAAHQPQYLPWLGYFDKIAHADRFVLLDTVQYKKNEWQNRNRIRGAAGWHWLTVPVHYRFPMTIRDVRVDATSGWRRKHKEALRQAYAKAPYREQLMAAIETLLDRPIDDLASLNIETVRLVGGMLGVGTPVTVASTLSGIPEGPDERLIALCKVFGCDTYLAGAGGRDYMNLDTWKAAGIAVEFQAYRHPVYPQSQPGFEPNLSAIDALMHLGPGPWVGPDALSCEPRRKAA